MVIVCPIISSDKKHPFLVPIETEKLTGTAVSKVNTNQVYSLDYTDRAKRNIQFVASLEEEQFYLIAQKFMYNFVFKI